MTEQAIELPRADPDQPFVYGFRRSHHSYTRADRVVVITHSTEAPRQFHTPTVMVFSKDKFSSVSDSANRTKNFTVVARDQHGAEAEIVFYSANVKGAIFRRVATGYCILRPVDEGIAGCMYATVDGKYAHIVVQSFAGVNILVPGDAWTRRMRNGIEVSALFSLVMTTDSQKLRRYNMARRFEQSKFVHADEMYQRRYQAQAEVVRHASLMEWARSARRLYDMAKTTAHLRVRYAGHLCNVAAEVEALYDLADQLADEDRAEREQGSV